ncbi:hypothetical protein GCM10009677_34200 [Sphaerisporangium rubeum]|uniref:Subtilisin inhibitor domain-containing protein n=1 Tax=Sphaerisporangium rubeum TaxID=321317 RepID=A0A7X0IL79_9ACTN|nr:SSI family serine proteinase inhibitor [Sphaerisporangium rubeum]MBB6476068.1 hypothetical protein [Sphaerisporangium rubeum]
MRPHLLLALTCALTATTPAPSVTAAASVPTTPGSAVTHPTTARPSTPGIRLARLKKPTTSSLTPRLKPHQEIGKVLLLAIAKGESPTPADHAVLLQCTPPGGTHPNREAACRLLDPVHADFNELNADPKAACSRDYNPITVYATGLWDTSRLSYEHTFGNTCELRATMGAVFDIAPR